MNCVPKKYGALAGLTDKKSRTASLAGVFFERLDGGRFFAAATNGKAAVMVEDADDKTLPADRLPVPPAAEPPSALVFGDVWKRAFAGLGRGQVAVVQPGVETTVILAIDRTGTKATTAAETMQNRYPPVREVVPKDKPLASMVVRPDISADLAKVLAAVTEDRPLTLEVHKHHLVFRGKDGEQVVTGLLMGCA